MRDGGDSQPPIPGSPLLEVRELFKRPTDERLGIQPQPVLHNRTIQAPEVMVGDDVALLQILGLHGGELTVLPALDPLAQDKGHPTGTVIGARAVVAGAAAKTRENEN